MKRGQGENEDNLHFLHRVDQFQRFRGILRREACREIGISEGQLSKIRNNQAKVATKFWWRLEAAERAAGYSHESIADSGLSAEGSAVSEEQKSKNDRFSERFEGLVDSTGKSVAQLCREMGISRTQIYDIKNKKIPVSDKMMELLEEAEGFVVRSGEEASCDFLRRTDELAFRLERSLEEIPDLLKISRASFYGYRGGQRAITSQVWKKLEAAERTAGISVDATSAGSIESRLAAIESELIKLKHLLHQALKKL